MLSIIKLFFSTLLNIIFPEFCIGCNKIGTLLCHKCFERLEFLQFKTELQEKHTSLDSITCCCSYTGLAKKIIREFKYKSVIAVGKKIADILYYTTLIPKCDIITFIPIHKKKLYMRGFNQTEIIAKSLGELLQKPVIPLLVKTKHTQSQMSIKKKNYRKNNIIGSITINPNLVFKNTTNTILLVDDVFTTGTTLNYCASILKRVGFKTIHGICFTHKS